MGASRRPSEPEKMPAPHPARRSALELKMEDLEEKGLIRILRGPEDAVSVANPSGSVAPTPGLPMGSPSAGAQELPTGGVVETRALGCVSGWRS